MTEREMPTPSSYEVVVRFHAASLNYRDVMFFKGVYGPTRSFPRCLYPTALEKSLPSAIASHVGR